MGVGRVAVVCPILFGDGGYFGGGTRYPLEFARAMAQKTPCDLVVFGLENGESTDEFGLRHVLVRDRVGQPNVDAFSFRMAAVLRGYDVVHFHTANKTAIAGAVASRLRGSTAVLTPLGGGTRTGLGRLGLHRLFRGFPIISEYTMVECSWIAGRPHTVIFGGGDAAGFREVPRLETRRDPRVVFIGRISSHKGVDILIEAMPPDVELIVCGQVLDPGYDAHLRRLAKGKRVVFLPPADDRGVSELYASATVSVLPSVVQDFRGLRYPHPELLGLVLLESMWHSTPVVASRVGAIPEIVTDGENGLLVPPNDPVGLRAALVRLLSDEGLATGLGRSGRRAVEERFLWSRVASDALRFYQEVS